MGEVRENETVSGEKRKKRRKLIIGLLLIFVLASVIFFSYVSDYYEADDEVRRYFDDTEMVKVESVNEGLFLDGPGTADALIFYPGAKVEYIAYLPLLYRLSLYGIDCFLVEMPFNLAFFGRGKASGIMQRYTYEKWYIGGHSLGGAMAASYATKHDLEGLILLASYPVGTVEERTLELYGSEDRVLNRRNRASGDAFMPKGSVVKVIEGGNHAFFGNYGAQKGDGEATITRDEQQSFAAEAIRQFVFK